MAKKVPNLTVPQIAQMIKMSDSVVHRAVKKGELVPVNLPVPGKKKFFARFDQIVVNDWINTHHSKPKKSDLPLFAQSVKTNTPPMAVLAGPGRLTSIDEKLDAILVRLDRLEKLWS